MVPPCFEPFKNDPLRQLLAWTGGERQNSKNFYQQNWNRWHNSLQKLKTMISHCHCHWFARSRLFLANLVRLPPLTNTSSPFYQLCYKTPLIGLKLDKAKAFDRMVPELAAALFLAFGLWPTQKFGEFLFEDL